MCVCVCVCKCINMYNMQRKVTKNPTTTYHPLYHSTPAVNIVGTNCRHIKQAIIAERSSLHELAGMEKGPLLLFLIT